MYLKLAPYIVLVMLAIGGYMKYKDMESTIVSQASSIQNYEIEVDILESNIELVKEVAEQDKEQAVSEAVNEQKKIQLEMEMKYDKKISYGLESTRFYLSY